MQPAPHRLASCRHTRRSEEEGQSLAGLSITQGYHPIVAGKALQQQWPAIERLVAAAIGIALPEIWPSQYSQVWQPKLVATR